jgi:hypothetical protein
MEKKNFNVRLPGIRCSRKTLLKRQFCTPSSVSPSLPRIKTFKKIGPMSRIQSPELSLLVNKTIPVKLPTKILNPSGFLKKVNESPIRCVNLKESEEESKDLEGLMMNLSMKKF